MISYSELVFNDVIGMCSGLLRKPNDWNLNTKTGKITPINVGIEFDPYWVHVQRAKNRGCEYWSTLFRLTKLRAERCFSCWKVVVRMSTVSDLFRLYDFMRFDFDHPCKCGWDDRSYTVGNYAGYFYCESEEQGLDVQDNAREGLKEVFKHDYSITLKRGCTEFEMFHGPDWEYTEVDRHKEQMFMKYVDIPVIDFEQPEIVIIRAIRRWLERASKSGDQTVKKFNNGNMIAPKLKSYERE